MMATTTFNYLSAQTTSPAPYCVADFDDEPFNVPDAINSVSIGTLTNATNSQSDAPHYTFYNNLPVPDLTKGASYPLKVDFEVNGGCGYGVWIDYNQNNVFEPSEKVSGTPVGVSLDMNVASITQNITIPATALPGQTRMRVRIVEDDNYTMGANGYSIMPCNASTSPADVMDWGETEDYTVNIVSSVGVNDINQVENLIVFPNPVSTTLNVNHDILDNATYKIVTVTGQEIQTGNLTSDKQINVSSLSEGVYFL